MLKEEVTTVIHPLFGKIRIEPKFAEVLKLKPFLDLDFKSQLGTKSLSPKILNAKHTRLMHSIGVMYLTGLFLDACEEKFSKYFKITQEERETFLLAALGHDIGHIAFSHSLEPLCYISHEERTVKLLTDETYSLVINAIFGYDIVSKVISIYENTEDIKEQGVNAKMEENLDFLFVFRSLLVGTIDCDRMEYLMTDKFMVSGEKVDFTDIFKYITIVLLNDSPTVGFQREAIPIIENMLITRFDQYKDCYYEDDSVILEMVLKEYVELTNYNVEDSTEDEILASLNGVLKNFWESDVVYRRLAKIILNKERENILFKKFEDEKEYNHFLSRLESLSTSVKYETSTKKVSIYNPSKNKVYIKDDDGVVKDIMDVSLKIREMSVNYYYVMVDVDWVYNYSEEEVKNIKALFKDNPVEIEKKFEFPEKMYCTVLDTEDAICDVIHEFLRYGIDAETTDIWDKVKNDDQYYNLINPVKDLDISNVAVRCRTSDGSEGERYYVKIPTDDGTSITKRREFSYSNCKSIDDFRKLLTSLLISQGFNVEEDKLILEKGVRIVTTRYKTEITYKNSIIELACDFSTYEYNGKTAKGSMLECELKKGDDLSLWYLTNELKALDFLETNEAKETRAKKALGII